MVNFVKDGFLIENSNSFQKLVDVFSFLVLGKSLKTPFF